MPLVVVPPVLCSMAAATHTCPATVNSSERTPPWDFLNLIEYGSLKFSITDPQRPSWVLRGILESPGADIEWMRFLWK